MFEKIFNQFVISFREGIEASLVIMTVMIAIKKRGDARLRNAAILGIGFAVLLSYALSKGIIKVHIGRFLQQTAYVLLFFVVQLIFDCLHEAYEGNFLPQPSSQGFANFVDYVHDQIPIFSYIALGL